MTGTAYSVQRGGGTGPLEFTGVRLATVSTEAPGKDRWSVLEIYRTVGGQYITHTVGASRLTGEIDIHAAHVHKTARDAVKAFIIRKTGKLSSPAIDLLDDAAEEDEAIDAALEELEEPVHVS